MLTNWEFEKKYFLHKDMVYRIALYLHYVEGYPCKEIAEILGKMESAFVKVTIGGGRKKQLVFLAKSDEQR